MVDADVVDAVDVFVFGAVDDVVDAVDVDVFGAVRSCIYTSLVLLCTIYILFS